MKTTIFAENFLKVFKIRSNDGPKYHVFSIPKIIFLEVSTKKVIFGSDRIRFKEGNNLLLRNSKSGIVF